MQKDLFLRVGGFDEINTPIMGSDVDLSFKIRELGFRLVYTPFTKLRHIGHATLDKWEKQNHNQIIDKSDLFLLKKWGHFITYDPFYPSNMREYLYKDSPEPYISFASNNNTSNLNTFDILCVSHDLTCSGAPIIFLQLLKHLHDFCKDYFLTLISPDNGDLATNYSHEQIPIILDSLILKSPNNSAITKLINSFDLVIANTILSYRVVLQAKRLNKPVIWLVHEGFFGYKLTQKNFYIQQAFKQADIVIFPSISSKANFKKYDKYNNFFIINYGIDLNFNLLTNANYRPLINSSNGKLSVVIVGSIEKRKGQHFLIEAIEKLSFNDLNKFEFYFIGRVLEKSYYSKLFKRTQFFHNINWLGEVSVDGSHNYISNSDILLCTSIDETGPLVVLEAMALQKLVITTPVGLVPEVIQHRINGLIIDPVNPVASIQENLLYAYDNPTHRYEMGLRVFETYSSKFTIDRYAIDICQFISNFNI
jgi:glycosyltransferase involved in cell wall biosynthesis